jgi:hypothetical protein
MSFIQSFKNISPKYRALPFGIFLLAIVIGIITRLWWNIESYNTFLGEQARDGEMMLGVWNKQYPRFGPVSSVGGYFIPPLYLYIGAIFAWFGNDPTLQAVSNMITSFVSIPLFGLIVFRSLTTLGDKYRILVSSVASLLWSLFAVDMFFSGFEWNPNSVTFWLMVFVINLDNLFNYWKTPKAHIFGWIWQGIILGILVSLHSSTLFMMPIIFGIYSVYWGIKQKSFYCLIGWVSFVASLWIYFREEFRTGFTNTKIIISTITSTSNGTKRTILDKIIKMGDTVWNIPNYIYFPNNDSNLLFGSIFILVIVFGFLVHKGNKFFVWFYILILGIYCLATSNYFGPYYMHYYAMIWAIGPVFLFLCLGSLFADYMDTKSSKYLITASWITAVLFVIIFGYFNAIGINNILDNKFSSRRTPTTDDMKFILTKVPTNIVICADGNSNALSYFDKYEYKKTRTIVDRCEPRIQYYIVGKYGFNFLRRNTAFDMKQIDPIYSQKVFENDQFLVLKQNPTNNAQN